MTRAELIIEIRSWGRGSGTINQLEQVLAEGDTKMQQQAGQVQDLTSQLSQTTAQLDQLSDANKSQAEALTTLQTDFKSLKQSYDDAIKLIPKPTTPLISTAPASEPHPPPATDASKPA